MRKQLTVLLLLVVAFSLNAVDWNFYGSARMTYFYEQSSKELAGNGEDTRLSLNYGLQGNSRFGAVIKHENYMGKIEMGLSSSNVALRQVYAEVDKGSWKFLAGQTYTGFSDFPDQVCDSDWDLIGFGMFYDGRKPMIKLSFTNGAYLIFMQPNKVDPAGELNAIDALLPKINFGYKYKKDAIYLHPTFGINMCKYNKDFSDTELDDSMMAYAFAITFGYKVNEMMSLLAQANYGANVKDYGIIINDLPGNQYYNLEGDLEDVITSGGFFQIKYDKFTAGLGYQQSDLDALDDADAQMSVYGNYKITICEKMFMQPEVGIIDFMEDGSGNKQGNLLYFGFKLQGDL